MCPDTASGLMGKVMAARNQNICTAVSKLHLAMLTAIAWSRKAQSMYVQRLLKVVLASCDGRSV